MWILESNGDFLQGKRMWLKPGKKYLFGRVKKDGVRFAIDHKTVSRKHFIIAVDPVKDEDVGRLHVRTKVTITDQGSKAGTNIDGKPIKDQSQVLNNAVTSIRPGSCPHELIIRWEPCVMTFGLQKKEIKTGVLKFKQEKVRNLDIKAVSDYISGETTHLVVQKRNTPKGLQALIEGRSIVSEEYIDALIYASTPSDVQEEENLSLLETDFDDAWPDAVKYLPPRGKEPTDKPAEAYKPDPARGKVFDKHTFFFFDQTQYDSLLPPVTTGHGKAQLFKMTTDATTVEEGLAFVRSAIGSHGHAIIIKLSDGREPDAWLDEYIEDLCSILGQEPAEQSQILDTILANDAALLRKPRAKTTANRAATRSMGTDHPPSQINDRSQQSSGTVRPESSKAPGVSAPRSQSPAGSRAGYSQPSAVEDSRGASQQSSIQDDDNPRPRKRSRFVPVKKVDFDDDFDPDAIAAYEEEEQPTQPKTQSRSQRTARSQAVGNGVTVKEEPATTPARSKSQTPDVVPDSDDSMDDLLPGAAAMRRQKQQKEAEARRKGLPVKSSMAQPSTTAQKKPRKEVKLLDVREAVRARRDAEEEAVKKEQEELEELRAEDEGNTGPANYVKVVGYDLPVREKTNGVNNYRGETWNPEWDGRKNFKGFRRARDVANGTAAGARRPTDKIIVSVVAVGNETFGLGDQYWEKTQEDKERAAREKERKKRASQKSTQSQRQNARASQRSSTLQPGSNSDAFSSDEDEDDNVNDDEAGSAKPDMTRLQREAEGVVDHAIDLTAPRRTRGHDTQASSRATASTGRSTRGHKRVASKEPPGRSASGKKQKTLPVTVVHGSDSNDSSDDSDDMKFQFGRARQQRAARL